MDRTTDVNQAAEGREVRVGAGAAPRASRSIAWLKVKMFFNSLAKRTCMNVKPPDADVQTPEAAVQRALAVLTKRDPDAASVLGAVRGIKKAANKSQGTFEDSTRNLLNVASKNDMQLLRLRGRLETKKVRNLRAELRLKTSGDADDIRTGLQTAERRKAHDLENTFRLLEEAVNGELMRRGFRPGPMKPVPEGRDHPAERKILDNFIAKLNWRYGAGKGCLEKPSLDRIIEHLSMPNDSLEKEATISGRKSGVCVQFYKDCNRLEVLIRREDGRLERIFPILNLDEDEKEVLQSIARMRELCDGDAVLLRNVSRYANQATTLWYLLFQDNNLNPVRMADGRRFVPCSQRPRVDPRAPYPTRFILSKSPDAGTVRLESVFEPRFEVLLNKNCTPVAKLEEDADRGRFVLEMDITRESFRLDPQKCTYEYAFKIADGPD